VSLRVISVSVPGVGPTSTPPTRVLNLNASTSCSSIDVDTTLTQRLRLSSVRLVATRVRHKICCVRSPLSLSLCLSLSLSLSLCVCTHTHTHTHRHTCCRDIYTHAHKKRERYGKREILFFNVTLTFSSETFCYLFILIQEIKSR